MLGGGVAAIHDLITTYGHITLDSTPSLLQVAAIHEKRILLLLPDTPEFRPVVEATIEAWKKAGDLKAQESAVIDAQKNKVSEGRNLAIHLEAYPRAIKIFEDLGKACTESETLKYSAKGYFFSAVLCHIAESCDKKEPLQDAVAAMAKYTEMDRSFDDEPGCRGEKEVTFLKKAIAAVEENEEQPLPDIDALEAAYEGLVASKQLDLWQRDLYKRMLALTKTNKEAIAAAQQVADCEQVELT